MRFLACLFLAGKLTDLVATPPERQADVIDMSQPGAKAASN
jgi:hypothetical protein